MPLSPGTRLGPYKILTSIGVGGMGEVYRAHDTKLERIVALKVLPSGLQEDKDRLRRFLTEAKAASALNHPAVAHIYEIGESDGMHFISMEYVEGETLTARIAKHIQEISFVVEVAIQAADTLEMAETKGITHRDIKPDNIMINSQGQVKVLDFGLAKICKPASDIPAVELDTLVKTTPGLLLGTVQYMSPEQALGKESDGRSDIFSLGVVFYEMTTGRLPFVGATTMEILDCILHGTPEAISKFNNKVPSELERIIRKCLEKDVARRYQSARDLQIDLRNLKRDLDSGLKQKSTKSSFLLSRFPYRAILVSLVLVATAIVSVQYLRSRSQPTIRALAVLPFVNEDTNPDTEYLSDGITEMMINSLSRLPDLRVMAPATVFTYKGKNLDPRKVGHELQVDAVVTGHVRKQGDMIVIQASLADVVDGHQLWGDQYTRKLSDIAGLQADISGEISKKLRSALTGKEQQNVVKQYTQNGEAYQLYLKGRYFANKKSNEGLKKAIEYYHQSLDKDPNYALAYAGLSDAYGLGEEIDDMYLAHANAAAVKALELDDNLAEVHVSIAGMKSGQWDWAGEEKEYQKAIELNPNLANAHLQYGDLLAAKGNTEKAIAETRMAEQLDPLSLHINTQVGTKLILARRYDEAIEKLRKTIEMDPAFGMTHATLGFAYLCKGMYPESIAEGAKGLTLSGEDPASVSEASKALLKAYSVSGARGYWEKRLDLDKKKSNNGTLYPPETALIYAQLGKKEEAFQSLEKAYQQHIYWLIFGGEDGYIKSNPLWDPIRNDPRYTDLLRRCNLL